MVEVMIVTKDSDLRACLLENMDKVIEEQRLKNLSLVLKHPNTIEAALQSRQKGKIYLLMIDIRDGVAQQVLNYDFENCFLIIMDDMYENMIRLVNSGLWVTGCLLCKNVIDMGKLADYLQEFHSRFPVSMNGILIYCEDEDLHVLVQMNDIFYIETIKGTHYGLVVCRDGSWKIRINLGQIMKYLPEYFVRIRSSTIVNMSEVKKIDFETCALVLSNGDICSFTAKNKAELKRRFFTEHFG